MASRWADGQSGGQMGRRARRQAVTQGNGVEKALTVQNMSLKLWVRLEKTASDVRQRCDLRPSAAPVLGGSMCYPVRSRIARDRFGWLGYCPLLGLQFT